MYKTIARVRYCDEESYKIEEKTYFFYSSGLEDASAQLISWFGNLIDKVTIEFGNDNLLELDEEMEKKILEDFYE